MARHRARIGLVGARGYVGQELIRVLGRNPHFEIAFVCSRTQAGAPISKHLPGVELDLSFEDLSAEEVAEKDVDAVVLALPNEQAAPVVEALDARRPEAVVVDVSADHRFHDGWVYGLPELQRAKIVGARRIANPGCYATAASLVIAPLAGALGRAGAVLRCLGLQRRRHHALAAQRRGRAARQPDAVPAGGAPARARDHAPRRAGGLHAARGAVLPRGSA